MILCPLQNIGVNVAGAWIQSRPVITQRYPDRPEVYQQFGLKGHGALDFRAKSGTPIFAVMDGYVYRKNDGETSGYGLHYKHRSSEKALEVVYAHLSQFISEDGAYVHMGDIIGYSGNTGFSSAPHLHFGVRRLIRSNDQLIMWGVENSGNGYKGYIDPTDFITCWKGSLSKNNLS